jgi:hypothetical protein
MSQHWPEVQFYFSLESAPRCDDTKAPAEDPHRGSTAPMMNTKQGERFDILSALPEEVAIYLLGVANHLQQQTNAMWSAWELRHVVGLVCRNWRRLALDASLLSTTLHQYKPASTRPVQDCATLIPPFLW